MQKRVADIIMESLAELGISQGFCVVGGGSMFLNNALRNCKDIKTIHNHHEQASAIACEGYARVKNQMAACFVTSGPGGTNALTGVMGAYQDGIPMMVVSGQVRYATTVAESGLNIRRRGEQEFDIVNSVQNMTKYAKMIIDPLSIRQEIYKAYDIAMHGHRGPVWLDIPLDVQSAMVETDSLYPIFEPQPILRCTDAQIDNVIEQIKAAKAPCILAGSAIASLHLQEKLKSLLEQISVPVVGAATIANIFSHEHPLYFGSTGQVGTRTGNFILQNADLLVVLGCSLGFKQTSFNQDNFAKNAKIIMVNISADEFKKDGLRINTPIQTDLTCFIDKLIEQNHSIEAPMEWLAYCNTLKSEFSIEESVLGKADEFVDTYNFWSEYAKLEPNNSVTVLGNSSSICPRLQFGVAKKEQVTFTNINCGSMGYDLPAAIGASQAIDLPIHMVSGDGCFMMNLQELQTAVFNKLPIKFAVFSNNGYGALMQTYKNYFKGEMFGGSPDSGLGMPSFEKIANAFNLPYYKCETNAQLTEALKWYFAQEETCFLEIIQKEDNPIMPVIKSKLNADGTSSPISLDEMFPFLSDEKNKSLKFS